MNGQRDTQLRPTPDWEKRRIVFTDASIWPSYTRGGGDVWMVFGDLENVLRNWNADVEILNRSDDPLDIWIRDWGFIEGAFFRYPPEYAHGNCDPAEVLRARDGLVRRLGVRCRALPVGLDGGNLIHNGAIAIVTEKVFRENPDFSRIEIERAIISLGFERVVFIPVEPGDEIGHADGMCRFVGEHVLLVNDYDNASLRSFGRRLRRVLRAAKLDAEFIGLPWFFRHGYCDGIPSAVGCYMNFIQLAQGIILPAFGHRKDDKAREVIESLTPTSIATIRATPLAKLGGVFNCISLSL